MKNMTLKDFLFDRRFVTLVRLFGLMCLSISITAVIILGILYGTSTSMAQFLDIVATEINRTILFVVAFSLFLGGFILISFDTVGYISSLPDNSFASFEEMQNQVQEFENLAKYRIPFLILFGVFASFCIGYFIGGNDWKTALQLTAKIAASISIAIAIACFFGIIIEVMLLSVRYLIWFSSKVR